MYKNVPCIGFLLILNLQNVELPLLVHSNNTVNAGIESNDLNGWILSIFNDIDRHISFYFFFKQRSSTCLNGNITFVCAHTANSA